MKGMRLKFGSLQNKSRMPPSSALHSTILTYFETHPHDLKSLHLSNGPPASSPPSSYLQLVPASSGSFPR